MGRCTAVAAVALALAGSAAGCSAVGTARHGASVASAAAVRQVTAPVLMYHYIRVNPVASDTTGFALSVTPADFAAQMALLRAEGFHTVSLADVRRAWDSGAALPPRPVVLTFDDGYADFATAALPALLRNGFTATAFVISGNVGRSGYMSAAQLAQVVAGGVTVGSHTVDHAGLTTLSAATVASELSASRARLQQLTGQPVDDFAYPYGSYDSAVAAAVQAAGYADAVTVASGTVLSSAQRYTLPRVHVNGGESLASFAQSVSAAVSTPTALVPAPGDRGYTVVARDGAVYALGEAAPLPSLAPLHLAAPLAGAAAAGGGWWAAAADGGVFTEGPLSFYGSMAGEPLNAPVTGIAATADARGYWLVAADGGVFTFGDAPFLGSMGGRRLNAPVVGIVATSSGRGYRLVAADGGVFCFGDAPFLGSMGGTRLNAPVVGGAGSASGYRLVGADGGVFTFGDAPFLGSMGGRRLNAPVVAMARTASGRGYWLLGADGGVFTFGDAPFLGATTRPL